MERVCKHDCLMDNALLQKFQQILERPEHSISKLGLLSLYYCSKYPYSAGEIGVLSNGERSFFTGLKTCRNPWYCPACGAVLAKKQAIKFTKIIQKFCESDIVPYMVTFTIPHVKSMSAKTVLELLTKIYRKFSTTLYTKNWSLTQAMGYKARITTSECTYTKNGFHFHNHCLLFCLKDRTEYLLKWVEKAQAYWNKLIQEFYAKSNLSEYATIKKDAVYLSCDANGAPRIISDGTYVTDAWSGSDELTMQYKKTHREDSRHPMDLLRSDNPEDWKIFIEYALATRYKKKYKLSNHLLELPELQGWENIKLEHDEEIQQKKTETVCVISLQNWYDILEAEIIYQEKIRLQILKLALQLDFDLIANYLQKYGIFDIRKPNEWEIEKTKKLFDKKIA